MVVRSWLDHKCLALASAIVTAAACSSSTNAADTTSNDDGTLSPAAAQGLAISPFTVDTTGLTLAQREQLGIGSYLVNAIGDCNRCHAQTQAGGEPTKYLGGGMLIQLDANTVVFARNLTTDADTGLALSKDQFVEAMRTGKDFRNPAQALLGMPWEATRFMALSDLEAVYAYLKVVPASTNAVFDDTKSGTVQPVPYPATYGDGDVDRPLPADDGTDPDHSLRGVAISPLADPPTLAEAEKAEFGRGSYLANAVAVCTDCHTNPARNLSPGASYLKINTAAFWTGGQVYKVPIPIAETTKLARTMSANLLGAAHGFQPADFAEFKDAVANGRRTENGNLYRLDWPMPFDTFKNMLDEDHHALYVYFKNLPRISGANDKIEPKPPTYCADDGACYPFGMTCNAATSECVGSPCAVDGDCAICQTCAAATSCAAPTATSACVTQGI